VAGAGFQVLSESRTEDMDGVRGGRCPLRTSKGNCTSSAPPDPLWAKRGDAPSVSVW